MADLYVVDWPMEGRLALMPRPAGGAALPEELKSLRDSGVDTLVSALTSADRAGLELVEEPALAVAAGMSYVSFPIEDFGVPDRDSLVDLAGSLGHELRDGRFVTVHCRGGVGRSGLIACAVLIDFGASASEAMEVVSHARGFDSPETEEQREMLRAIAV
jgi:protein-tyrosine phosphatase